MKLEIYYDPESDTLDIGNGQPASEGYDVADQPNRTCRRMKAMWCLFLLNTPFKCWPRIYANT